MAGCGPPVGSLTRDKIDRLTFRRELPCSAAYQVSCERDEDGDLKMKGVEGIALTRTSSADDVRFFLTFARLLDLQD